MAIFAQLTGWCVGWAEAEVNALRHDLWHFGSGFPQIEGRMPARGEPRIEPVGGTLLAPYPCLEAARVARSNTAAIPCPPPMHIVSSP